MKKKLIAMTLLLCLTTGALTACGDNSAQSTGEEAFQNTEEGEVQDAEEEAAETVQRDFTFGFNYMSYSDALGKKIQKVTQQTCDILGVDTNYAEFGSDMENTISTIQNQIELGVDAVSGSFAYSEILQMCEDNDVVQMYPSGYISDPDMLQYVAGMSNFGGFISENDYEAAYDAVNTLYENGCRNIGLITMPDGLADFMDQRNQGVRDAVAEHDDMNLITDYQGFPGDYGTYLSQWLSVYPELDGVVNTSNDGTCEAAIYTAEAQDKVKLAVFDLQDGTKQAIEDGIVAWCATGQENTWVISVILAYNQLCGHDLIEDNTTVLYRPFLYIRSAEDVEIYDKYVDGDIPVYNEEEIKALIYDYNPDVTIDDIIAVNAAYSIEDIAARRGE